MHQIVTRLDFISKQLSGSHSVQIWARGQTSSKISSHHASHWKFCKCIFPILEKTEEEDELILENQRKDSVVWEHENFIASRRHSQPTVESLSTGPCHSVGCAKRKQGMPYVNVHQAWWWSIISDMGCNIAHKQVLETYPMDTLGK